jgi:hypothetical protein
VRQLTSAIPTIHSDDDLEAAVRSVVVPFADTVSFSYYPRGGHDDPASLYVHIGLLPWPQDIEPPT